MSKQTNSIDLLLDAIDARVASGLSTPPQLLGCLKRSAMNQQIKIFRSPAKAPIGYVAWANVNKYSFLMMSKTKQMPPYLYEWSEGRLLVIYDIAFAPQWSYIARKALIKFLKKKRFVSFLRRGRLHLWSKSVGKLTRTIL